MYQSTVNPYGSHQVKPRLAEHMLYAADKLENGHPSIYRLHMREENRHANSTFAEKSIGWPRDNREAGVFLLVGATGAGKSTLINGMVNYILGVEWKDDFRFKVTTDDSQTKDITAYTFHPMEHSPVQYSFTIIDTPGFGAAEGLKTDEEVAEQINKIFSNQDYQAKRIDHVNGIGFVIPASQASLAPTQEYIYDSILSMFGGNVYKNIVMLRTFADCHRPPILMPMIKPQIPNHQFVKFNNSGLFAKNDYQTIAEQTFNGMFWNMSFTSFRSFFEVFSGMFHGDGKQQHLHVAPLRYVRGR